MGSTSTMVVSLVLAAVLLTTSAATGMDVTIGTDRPVYYWGDPITITITMYNPTDQAVDLYSPNSCTHDYWMDNTYWSRMRVLCLQMTVETQIAPGQTRIHEMDHDMLVYEPVAGTHTLRGSAYGYGTPTSRFEVVRVRDIPGDADWDYDVDLDDFILLKGVWGSSDPPDILFADWSRDGQVGLDDFMMMKGNFGVGEPLPEPASLTILTFGGLALLRRQSRRS